MPSLLLYINLPKIPRQLHLENIPNPITGKPATNGFGKIRVNSHEWGVVYDDETDLWWVSPRPESKFYEVLYTQLFYSSPLPEQFGYANLETDGTRRARLLIKKAYLKSVVVRENFCWKPKTGAGKQWSVMS